MTTKQKLIAIVLVGAVFFFPVGCRQGTQDKAIPAEDYRKVDFTLTVDTSKPFRFIDSDGRDVGGIGEFEGEVTVTIRRVKR